MFGLLFFLDYLLLCLGYADVERRAYTYFRFHPYSAIEPVYDFAADGEAETCTGEVMLVV